MKLEIQKLHANGKLLISGEYAVLDGAIAFAVPTKLGQSLEVSFGEETANPVLIWEAYLVDGSLWFSAEYELKTLTILKSSDAKFASKLLEIFKATSTLNPNFFQNQNRDVYCKTQLEFPKEWGLGSSSTLIYLLAKLTEVNEFELNKLTFKTSGYDVACAGNNSPIIYQNHQQDRRIEPIDFSPEFKEKLHFVYLNQKQDTQQNVAKNYRDLPKDVEWINAVSDISYQISQAENLEAFERLLNQHEDLIALKLGFPKVKDLHFPDYEGAIKSLGAWGGDFVLITERKGFKEYFQSKGFTIVLSFDEMINKK